MTKGKKKNIENCTLTKAVRKLVCRSSREGIMYEKHSIRSWLSIDSNNESGMENSIPEETKPKKKKKKKKSNQIKFGVQDNIGQNTIVLLI